MTGIQMFLIFVGILAIICSFVFAEKLDKKDNGVTQSIMNQDIEKMTKDIVNEQVNKEVDRILDDKMEVTEVEMEKISNEKILAMGDYYETVIGEISKNHDEVMFLYGMLNDKEKDIKNTVRDVENVKKSIIHLTDKVQDKTEQSVATDEMDSDDGMPDSEKDMEHKEKKKEKTYVEKEQEYVEEKNVKIEANKKKGIALSHKEAKKNTNNNQLILDLYNEGKTNMEIAKQLKLGVGEVRLVIDLYKNRK